RVVGRCCGLVAVGGGGLLGRGLGRRLGGGGLLGRIGRGCLVRGLRDVDVAGLGGRLGLRRRGRGRRLARRQLAALLLAEDLVQRDRDAGQQRVEAARQAGDRRGDHPHELPVEDLARREPRDRDD